MLRIGLFTCFVISLEVLQVHVVNGYGSYRNKIPNGDSVVSPCPNVPIWPEVGHLKLNMNRLGGVSPTKFLNPFGEAFLQQGKQFTKTLCEDDSDGDGVPNWQELGMTTQVQNICNYALSFGKKSNENYLKTNHYLSSQSSGHPGICEYGRPTCKHPSFKAENICPFANSPQMAPPTL